MSNATWSLWIESVAALATVGATLAVLWQLRQFRVQEGRAQQRQREDAHKARKQATLDFYVQTLGERTRLREALPPDHDAAKIRALIEECRSNRQLGDAVTHYLGYWGMLAVAVLDGGLEYETVRRIAGARIVRVYDSYRTWIDVRRKELDTPHVHLPLEILAERLRADGPFDASNESHALETTS